MGNHPSVAARHKFYAYHLKGLLGNSSQVATQDLHDLWDNSFSQFPEETEQIQSADNVSPKSAFRNPNSKILLPISPQGCFG